MIRMAEVVFLYYVFRDTVWFKTVTPTKPN